MPDYTTTLINYRIERAKEAMSDALDDIEKNRLFSASNRIYYAIFYMVSALSLKNNFSTSKHKQLMGWFNHNFYYTGKVDKRL